MYERPARWSRRTSPGAPLKQDEIAADFDVSHTPVREALKVLVAEGLATLHHTARRFLFAANLPQVEVLGWSCGGRLLRYGCLGEGVSQQLLFCIIQ